MIHLFQKQFWVPIWLGVSMFFIVVTKLWDMNIGQWMCKGCMGPATVLESKWSWLMTNEHDIVLPVTIKW